MDSFLMIINARHVPPIVRRVKILKTLVKAVPKEATSKTTPATNANHPAYNALLPPTAHNAPQTPNYSRTNAQKHVLLYVLTALISKNVKTA
jgi:hypothetical protein